MTGLSVLYTSEAAEAQDWAAVPDRDRTGRLREVYRARRAELKSGRKRFVNATLYWGPNRTEIGRRGDEPGDGFVYLVSMAPRVEDRFEWLEVTEVFTTVPASRIEGAMRVWNGIADKHPVDFDEFRRGLRRGRPSRVEQRRAADRTIAQIERKLGQDFVSGTAGEVRLRDAGGGDAALVCGSSRRSFPGGERDRRFHDADNPGTGGRQAKGVAEAGLPVQEGCCGLGHDSSGVKRVARGEVGAVRGRGQRQPGESRGRVAVGDVVGWHERGDIENGDLRERGAVHEFACPRGGTEEGVGRGTLPGIRRGSWWGPARA